MRTIIPVGRSLSSIVIIMIVVIVVVFVVILMRLLRRPRRFSAGVYTAQHMDEYYTASSSIQTTPLPRQSAFGLSIFTLLFRINNIRTFLCILEKYVYPVQLFSFTQYRYIIFVE